MAAAFSASGRTSLLVSMVALKHTFLPAGLVRAPCLAPSPALACFLTRVRWNLPCVWFGCPSWLRVSSMCSCVYRCISFCCVFCKCHSSLLLLLLRTCLANLSPWDDFLSGLCFSLPTEGGWTNLFCVQVPDAAPHPKSCRSPVDVTYFGKGSQEAGCGVQNCNPATRRCRQENQEFKIFLTTK